MHNPESMADQQCPEPCIQMCSDSTHNPFFWYIVETGGKIVTWTDLFDRSPGVNDQMKNDHNTVLSRKVSQINTHIAYHHGAD